MAEAAKEGSGGKQMTQTFDGRLLGRGFYEVTDDGQVIYYDMMGNKMDVDRVGAIQDDPDNPPNGVVYYSSPIQVITY
jgi:hypothetical protein